MKRPFSVTILLWLVLCLTVWGLLRLVSAILWWDTLRVYASPPGPLYITISGGAWLIIGIALLWGMWRAKAWIRQALLGAGTGFTVWYWSDRLLLQAWRANWVFMLYATVLLLFLVMICIVHPRTKEFFTE